MSFWKLCAAADRAAKRKSQLGSGLSNNWDSMSVGALWEALNDPCRRPTPNSTIDAISYSVRKRGIAALKEPPNVERLRGCDDAAKAKIKQELRKLDERRSV
jgi:hypothetical protein